MESKVASEGNATPKAPPSLIKKEVQLREPKTCRIFFSSPFGGMEEEREELTRKYFPQFQVRVIGLPRKGLLK